MDEQRRMVVDAAIANSEENTDIRFLETGNGFARAELTVKPNHKNSLGIVYGGLLYHMADLTSGIAYMTVGGYGPTVSGNMQFINSVGSAEHIICEARVAKLGHHIGFIQADIYGEDGQLVARGTYDFFNSPKPV